MTASFSDVALDDRARDRGSDLGRARVHRAIAPAVGDRRRQLLAARDERQAELLNGGTLDFPAETREIREGDWRVAPPREDYLDRRVEITGPTDRKLVINALNSGARGFMADFEDANSPSWANQVEGHLNLIDAIERTITYDSSDGRHYELNERTATLLVRPRGWHLDEKHLRFDEAPLAGALMDFGLFAFHCGGVCSTRGPAPTCTCPSSSTTSRRDSGTMCSPPPSRRSGFRRAPFARPC